MKLEKVLIALAVLLITFSIISLDEAFADAINYGKGGPQFHYANPFKTFQTAPNSDWYVEIHLPANNATVITAILSPGNYTDLEQNIATMAVENISPTNVAPTTNYCPIALAILQGQDGYLSMYYNATTGFDRTNQIYPAYCIPETGTNPIDGQSTVPEFPFAQIILIASIIGIISIRWNHR